MSEDTQKRKMYLAVGIIMIVIVTAWILSLKNSLTKNNQQPNPDTEKWQEISSDFNQLFSDVKDLRQAIGQASTSTSTVLQPAAEINPEDLDAVIEKLKTSTTTTSTDDLTL